MCLEAEPGKGDVGVRLDGSRKKLNPWGGGKRRDFMHKAKVKKWGLVHPWGRCCLTGQAGRL